MSNTDTILCTAEELRTMIADVRLSNDRLEVRLNELQDINLRQRSRIETLTDQVTDCERVHKDDISIIGEEIIRVFNENDFCSIADKALAVLNEKISGKFPLPVRKEDRTVTWVERFMVTVQRSEEFLSISDEDAIEQAKNSYTGASIQDIRQAVTDGEYYLDECQNWEVE
jgi:hypothetical protein